MRDYRSFRTLLLAGALVGLTACASPGGESMPGTEPSGDGVLVSVTNDISPPTSVVIWVINQNGMRRRLGPVPPNGRREFSYDTPTREIPLHLLAVPEGPSTGTMGGTRERESNEFSILDVKSVTWTVSRQNVTVGR